MAFNLIGYRDKYKDHFGDAPLEDVARDAFEVGGYAKTHGDYETWKKASGIDSVIAEDNDRRKPFEQRLKEGTASASPIKYARSFLQGGAEGLTTELPSMVGGAVEFAGSYLPGKAIEKTGKSIKDWAEEKRIDWYGPVEERTGLDRIIYEGARMLAPSIIPGGIAATGAKALKIAKTLGDANKIGAGAAAGLFGLSQAQQTRDTAIKRAEILESQGNYAEAQKVRESGYGVAPIATGSIEALGEYFGTLFLGRLFGLDEAVAGKIAPKEFAKNLLKTLGVEVGTEMGQASGESAVEKISGIRPNAEPLQEAIDVIGPTAFMTLLTGGLAGAANKLRSEDPKEREASVYLENLKIGAMTSMAIHTGLKTGQYEGQPFTKGHALELMKAGQENGIFTPEDIDRFHERYPALKTEINDVLVESLKDQVTKAVRPDSISQVRADMERAKKIIPAVNTEEDVPLGLGDILVDGTEGQEVIDNGLQRQTETPIGEQPQSEATLSQENVEKEAIIAPELESATKPAEEIQPLPAADVKPAEEINLPPEKIVEPGETSEEPKTKFDKFVEKSIKKDVAEAQGKAILDELDESRRAPSDVSKDFWDKTYWNLDGKDQAKFQDLLKKQTGMDVGSVLWHNPETGEKGIAKDIHDIAKNFEEDLPSSAEYLEGTERGYVSLMEWANKNFEGKEQTGDTQKNALPAPLEEAKSGESSALSPAEKEKMEFKRAEEKRIIQLHIKKIKSLPPNKRASVVANDYYDSVKNHVNDLRKLGGIDDEVVTLLKESGLYDDKYLRELIPEHQPADLPKPPEDSISGKVEAAGEVKEPAEIFIRKAERKDLGKANTKSLAAIPEKEGYAKVYKKDGKQGRGFYYVKLKEKVIKVDNSPKKQTESKNLAQFIINAGKVRLGSFTSKTGTAWDRAHGTRGKDQSREMGVIKAVASVNGKFSMDEAASMANAEGYRDSEGNPFTDVTLFRELAEGDARKVLRPDLQESKIEAAIEERENEWITEQLAKLTAEGIDAGRRIEEDSESIISDLNSEIEAEGYSPEQLEENAQEIADFFEAAANQAAKLDAEEVPVKLSSEEVKAKQSEIAGTSEAENFSLDNPTTDMSKHKKLSEQVTPKNEDLFAEPKATPSIPAGWTEAMPGKLATNKDPVNGGIIDNEIVSGKWFVVPNNDAIPKMEGFATRQEAFDALADAVKNLPAAKKVGEALTGDEFDAIAAQAMAEVEGEKQPEKAKAPFSKGDKVIVSYEGKKLPATVFTSNAEHTAVYPDATDEAWGADRNMSMTVDTAFVELVQEPKTQEETKAPETKKVIGRNSDGQVVVEDKNGVRSIKNNSVYINEPVQLIPTRGGVQASVDVANREDRFKTTDELKSEAPAAQAEAKPFKVGDRVVMKDGRHGEVVADESYTMQTTSIFGGGKSVSKERTIRYRIKSDAGAEYSMYDPAGLTIETERPENVIPDILSPVSKQYETPDDFMYHTSLYRRDEKNKRAAAQRARKQANINDYLKQADQAKNFGDKMQAAFNEWAAKYPEEAKKYQPEPVATPAAKAGTTPVPGQDLHAFNLHVTKTQTKTGKTVWEVSGSTKEHMTVLKAAGGRWYGPKKVWSFYNADPTDDLLSRLGVAPKPAEAPQQQEPKPSLTHAATEAGKGVEATYDALAALFKAKAAEKRGSLSGLDSDLYAAVKPLFAEAYQHFRAAGREVKDWIVEVVSQLKNRGISPADSMPYVKHFYMNDMQALQAESKEVNIGQPDNIKVVELSGLFYDMLESGEYRKMNKVDIQNFVAKQMGISRAALTNNPAFLHKPIEEAFEYALVKYARKVISDGRYSGKTTEQIYYELKEIYLNQPNLATRTSTSKELQAFSTPIHLAFLAQEFAGVTLGSTVYEPTAGTGMLLTAARPENVLANEMDKTRAAILKDQGFTTTERDGRNVISGTEQEKSKDAVLANPPFNSMTPKKIDGYTISKLEHEIMMDSLSAMKDNGKAAFIIGGHNFDSNDGTMIGNQKIFLNWLYNSYNVIANIDIPGTEYARQGAKFDVRLIVINGRKEIPGNGIAPRDKSDYLRVDSIDKILPILEVVKNEQGALASTGIIGGRSGEEGSRPTGATVGQGGRSELSPSPRSEDSGSNQQRPRGGATSSGQYASQGVRDQQGGQRGGNTGADVPGRGLDGSGVELPVIPPGGNESKGNKENIQGQRTGNDEGVQTGTGRSDADGISGTDDGLLNQKPAKQEIEKTEYQVTYTAKSKGNIVDEILIPRKMKEAIDKALEMVEAQVGNIDDYVQDKLKYKTKKKLYNALSADQIDAVALAIFNIDHGIGMIIGDQTGTGKGRIAAAILMYARKTGLKPVFFTEKPNLFTDIYRDIVDIGDDFNPFIVASKKELASILDQEGKVVFTPPGGPQKNRLLNGAISNGQAALGDKDTVLLTYSQVNKAGNLPQQAIERLAVDNFVVLDESHNASGVSNTGDYIRRILAPARGVLYMSATYAKRPDTMPLYYKTSMSQANLDMPHLVSAIETGGTPLQEIVSNALAAMGQLIRREKSFKGININTVVRTQTRQQDEQRSDQMTSALRGIVELDADIGQAIDDISQTHGEDVLGIPIPSPEVIHGDVVAASVSTSNFASTVHNAVRQMTLCMKAPMAVEYAINELKKGNKPVIALSNTMGSFLEDQIKSGTIKVGDPMNMSFADVLKRHLRRTLRIKIKAPNGDISFADIDIERLPRAIQEKYAVLEARIDSIVTDVPGSPIDYILSELTKAGYHPAEITARKYATNLEDPQNPTLRERSESEISKRNPIINGFNNGKVDALIINAAGATGLSVHAGAKFKDQRPRSFIGLQAEMNIDTEVQKMGRINRKGQVHLPQYYMLQLDIPAEIRPAAVLMRKMKSLSANTSANSDSVLSQKEIPDMFNKYGNRIAREWFETHPIAAHLLHVNPDANDFMLKITGHLAIQPVALQKEFFEEVESEYEALISELKEEGIYDLEVEELDFQARTETRQLLTQGNDESNFFGQSTWMEKISVRSLKKPFKANKIKSLVEERLAGNAPGDVASELADQIERETENYIAAKLVETDNANMDWTDQEQRVRTALRRTLQRINHYQIGSVFNITEGTHGGGLSMQGVLIDVKHENKAGNPAAPSKIKLIFAVNNALQKKTVSFAAIEKNETSVISAGSEIPYNWDSRLPSEVRLERYVMTGNLLQGFADAAEGSKVIRFTTENGQTREAILMPLNFNPARVGVGDTVRITTEQAHRLVTMGNNQIALHGTEVKILPRGGGEFNIRVPRSRAKGEKYYADNILKRLTTTNDFETRGQEMSASIHGDARIGQAIERIYELGDTFSVPRHQFESVYGTSTNNNSPQYSVSKGNETVTMPTLPEVREVFKGQEVTEVDGGFAIRTQGGQNLIIRSVEHISPNGAVLNISYGRKKLNGDIIAGAYSQGKIKLAKGQAGKWTLAHESVHFMEDIGVINQNEVTLLKNHIRNLEKSGKFTTVNKEDIGGEEDRANFIATAITKEPAGLLGRIIAKIKDFIDKLVNAFGIRTAGGIARDIRTGKVYDRQGGAGRGLDENYSVKTTDRTKVFDANGKEVGFYVTRPEMAFKPGDFYIDFLTVNKELRGTGKFADILGQISVDAESEGAERVVLEVADEDAALGPMYKRYGFREAKSKAGNYFYISVDKLSNYVKGGGNVGSEGKGRVNFQRQKKYSIRTDAFKKWFGNSQVVDENGEPLVVYKGMLRNDWRTGKEINEINSTNGPWAGFFTSLKPVAKGFEEAFATMGEARTLEVYLAIKNPYIIDAKGKRAKEFMFDDTVFGKNPTNPGALAAFNNGYDGVIIKNTEDEGDVYIPKSPNQVKSATDNVGTFDENNPDIRYSIRKSQDPPTSRDPKVLNLYLKDETDAILQTIMNKLHPRQMTWLETMLKSPEWFEHPVVGKIVKLFMRDRSEIYHQTFNDLNAVDDIDAPEKTVTEAGQALKNKGLSLADRIAGKESEEYQQLKKFVDYFDTSAKRNQNKSDAENLKDCEAYMKKNGATDDVIRVWKLYRASYDKALDLMTRQLKDLIVKLKEDAAFRGEKVDVSELEKTLNYALAEMQEWRGYYAPRLREAGDWKVQAYKEHGPMPENREYYREHKGSELSAQRLAKKLEREGWKVYSIGKVERLPESVYQDVRSAATAKLIDSALDKVTGNLNSDRLMKFNEEILRTVADEIRARGFRSTMIHRQGQVIRGYIEDPIKRHLLYTNNLSGGIAKSQVARQSMELLLGQDVLGKRIGGIDPVKDPEAYKVATNYIEEQLRNLDASDRAIGLAKSIATFKFLGFNIRSLAVNMTALVTTAPAAIHQYAMGGKGSMFGIMKELGSAGKDFGAYMAGKKLNTEEQAFLDDMHRKGWDDPQYTRDALGTVAKAHSRAWEAVMNSSMYLFGQSEKFNRGTTILAAYRLARKQGLSDEAAQEKAKEASDKAHGVYGRSTLPMWAQGANPAAKIGQMLYVYSKFSHNYLQMLYDMGFKKHNIKGAMFAFLSPLVVAGGAALPFKGLIFGLAGAILSALGWEKDPEKWVWDQIREHLGGDAERIGRHGLTGAAGVDISGSLSIGVGVPKGLMDLTGAIGGVAEAIGEGAGAIKRGEKSKAAEAILPTGIANPLKAYRESQEGISTKKNYPVFDESGRVLKPSGTETAEKVLGFRSARQAVLSERTWEAKRQQSEFTEQRNDLYRRYRSFLLSGKKDRAEYMRIVKDVREFNANIRESGLQREVPFITSESLKSQERRVAAPTKRERAILMN